MQQGHQWCGLVHSGKIHPVIRGFVSCCRNSVSVILACFVTPLKCSVSVLCHINGSTDRPTDRPRCIQVHNWTIYCDAKCGQCVTLDNACYAHLVLFFRVFINVHHATQISPQQTRGRLSSFINVDMKHISMTNDVNSSDNAILLCVQLIFTAFHKNMRLALATKWVPKSEEPCQRHISRLAVCDC